MSDFCKFNSKWMPYRQNKSNAKIRLFILHHAGGSASICNNWFQNHEDDIEILPLELPGHETRIDEKLIDTLPDLCESLIEVIAPMTDLPYAFFGHSMGALVAFETTRLLRKNNVKLPSKLFLSAHIPPDQELREKPMYNLDKEDLIKELKRMGGTSEELLEDSYFAELYIPIIRADMAICEKYIYSYQTPLPVPIHMFGGFDDITVTPEELLGWRKQTTSNFVCHIYDGGHFYLVNHLDEIFSIIKSNLCT